MAESKPEQEPSIEEILASIRQIISDEDDAPKAPAAKEPVAAPVKAPEPEQEPEVVVEPELHDEEEDEGEDDILELTSNMQEDEDVLEIADDDLDTDFEIALAEINETLSHDEPEEQQDDQELEEFMPAEDDFEDIISSEVQSAALASMAKLASGMPVSKPVSTPRQYDGVTLEDIVRDLLHPMLREWMDDNLPPMVERIVQKEMEKLTRRLAE